MKRILPFLLICLSYIGKGQETLKVGVISYKSNEKVKQTFEPVFQYVAKELDRKLAFTVVPEDDLAFHLDNQDFDIGLFTIFPYLKAKDDFSNLHVFASHQVKDEGSFHGIILATKSSGIEALHQLKGKDFLFVKPTSTSGYKYPKGIFTESDLDIDNQFFSYDFSYNHDKSLDSLIAGNVDGIAINESYFLKRTDINQEDFNILSRYEVPYHAYVFAPQLDHDVQEAIEKVLFNAHKDPKAKQLFQNALGVTSIVPEDDNYYNIIRRYLRITRVKPVLDLHIKPLGKAAQKLEEEGDMLRLVEDKTIRGLLKTKRFSPSSDAKKQYYEHILVNLYQVSKGIYHYQVLLNDVLVDEGKDISEKDLSGSFHEYIRNSVLLHLPVTTELLYNGKNWFINYGHNDGFTEEDYRYEIDFADGALKVQDEAVSGMTDLNTRFVANEWFRQGAKVKIIYKSSALNLARLSDEGEETSTINIFSSAFWKTHYWDKLGLIIGILLTVVSALIGGFLRKRKKEKFKGLLTETNELIKECIGEHYKMENKILEQKEKITDLLENGKINENQYLILKNRIADLQGIIDSLEPQHIQLTNDQKEQIEEIVSDGKISEKEFLKIKNILKKRA